MPPSPTSFGELLRSLRKRAGMTQDDLAAAVGYSGSFISALEQGQRLLPALLVEEEPHLAAHLVELAAAVRGERPPASLTVQRAARVVIQQEVEEQRMRLPAVPTELIGRAGEVHQLCNRLLGHRGRLLTLVGPPGIGKTTLALAMADHLHYHYRDGAVFVALTAVGDAVLMAATIATAVGSSDASPK
jgi:transcriptional regulator with XRE-family HTH domain